MQANLEPLPQLHLPAQKAYAVHPLYAVCFTNNTRKTSQKFLRLSQISHWLQNLTKVLCFLYLGKFCSLEQEGRNSRTAGNHYQVLQYKNCTDTHTHTQKKVSDAVPQEGAFFHFNKVSGANGKPDLPPSASASSGAQEGQASSGSPFLFGIAAPRWPMVPLQSA